MRNIHLCFILIIVLIVILYTFFYKSQEGFSGGEGSEIEFDTAFCDVCPLRTGQVGPEGDDGNRGDRGPKGFQGIIGPEGPEGDTVYEYAVDSGYHQGSENEWTEFIEGDNDFNLALQQQASGEVDIEYWYTSTDGEDISVSERETAWRNSRKADENTGILPGKNAYELAKETDNSVGSMSNWRTSIQGDTPYEIYKKTTSDSPIMSENEFNESLVGDVGDEASQMNFPIGTIVFFQGQETDIPSGWALCNGENNTPDLRNKFILGASSNYSYRNTGGEEEVTLQEEHIRHQHGGKLNSGGAHTHNITINNKTIDHTHRFIFQHSYGIESAYKNFQNYYGLAEDYFHSPPAGSPLSYLDGENEYNYLSSAEDFRKMPGNTPRDTTQDGNHSHVININEGGEHSHNLNFLNSFGGNRAGETVAHNNLPTYYVLSFIIRKS